MGTIFKSQQEKQKETYITLVDKETSKRIKRYMKKTGISKSAFVRMAINEKLNREEKND